MPQTIDLPPLTVRAISAVGVEVPMTYVLGTSRGRITKAPLLLIDVETAEGITGRAYLWSYFPRAMVAIASMLKEIEERTKGERVVPAELWSKLAERFALIGVQGIVRMAMAGFDVACWDALAVAAGAAAGAPARRRAAAHPRVQFLRARPDADGCAGRRGREAARARLSRDQAAARLSDARRRPRRGPRGQEAHPATASR